MRGITFKLRNEYSNFLYKIFYEVEVGDFTWSIGDNEIIYKDKNDNLNTSIFFGDVLSGAEFLTCIQLGDYYLVFADIKAFKNGSQITNISSYEEFIDSDCVIALFCTDSEEIEFYCKDTKVLDQVISNCEQFSFKDFHILTEENDGRLNFSL